MDFPRKFPERQRTQRHLQHDAGATAAGRHDNQTEEVTQSMLHAHTWTLHMLMLYVNWASSVLSLNDEGVWVRWREFDYGWTANQESHRPKRVTGLTGHKRPLYLWITRCASVVEIGDLLCTQQFWMFTVTLFKHKWTTFENWRLWFVPCGWIFHISLVWFMLLWFKHTILSLCLLLFMFTHFHMCTKFVLFDCFLPSVSCIV